MKIIRSLTPGDRYRYDLGICSPARGWAQVDTAQDASWFGTWASPAERTILNYAEGDVTLQICETDEEFAQAMRDRTAITATGRRRSIRGLLRR